MDKNANISKPRVKIFKNLQIIVQTSGIIWHGAVI